MSMPLFTIEEFARDFLKALGLSQSEIDAAIKVSKQDSSLHVQWQDRVTSVPFSVLNDLREVLRFKVIYWMAKYRPEHEARAMFTGEKL